MARRKPAPSGVPAAAANKPKLSGAERSAYFARREAAKVLRTVLQGDATRRAVGSIKSLVYGPSVRNKKATFALLCQTLKYLPIIKDILEMANVLNSKWKRQRELTYVITYDILFGQATSLVGDAEKFLISRRNNLQSSLARLIVRRKVNCVEDLVAIYQPSDVSKPRYVRVNTLKLDAHSAFLELGKEDKVEEDDLVPDLLKLPPGSDLHNHHLVINGSIFLQGKASSMVAVALDPQPGWEVLDACSAPGNKTVHLAALMRGKGKILACELNEERVRRLESTVKLSGATNIDVLHTDFLNINPNDPPYSRIRAILLDPSCSGSGTTADRLDYLLPSNAKGQDGNAADTDRLNKLAAFQKKALEHALSFPAVEKIVYSTCSIHQIENEDVVKSVIPLALSKGFRLATPFPQWQRRGLPIFEGAEHLLRTDPTVDKEGFFIALFVKTGLHDGMGNPSTEPAVDSTSNTAKKHVDRSKTRKRKVLMPLCNTMFKMWLFSGQKLNNTRA